MASPDALRIALADRYRLDRQLGQGGMATVYLAHDLKHDRDVALKVLRPELAAVLGRERFLAEIRLTARLDHPHILTLIDSGESVGFLWYVLPYVRGESLRDRLTRDKQLAIEEALAITRQIAGALEYAHQHGVIHRDIKPENILFHEGEAMLADFGIALAVKEAAGNRLTETGLSLGTPQYMSPEQATGDRQLDARSDVYSLAAVLYEMLAGEPPVTGPTVQAVIAKLMTERPTRLRVIRDTVPEGVDNAVARALAKVPADRFRSAGELAEALTASGILAARPARRWARMATAAAAIALLATLALFVTRAGHGRTGGRWVVQDRTQLTFTGSASNPGISADGKQVAYVAKRCAAGVCRAGIQILDLGSGATRLLVDSVDSFWPIRWSWDRRFLLFRGRIGNRLGSYFVSTVGDNPRPVRAGWGSASFVPGRDSLVVSLPNRPDSFAYVAVAPMGADYRDSVPLGKVGVSGDAFVVPGDRWLIVDQSPLSRHRFLAFDRLGRPSDSIEVPYVNTWEVSSPNAFWLQDLTRPFPIVRVPFDTATGRFGGPADTVLMTSTDGFDVSADGGSLVYADGAAEYGIWALDLADALKGHFPVERRLGSGTSPEECRLSPDGSRLLLLQTVTSGGREGRDIVLFPFQGGPALAHWFVDSLLDLQWMPDGQSFTYAERAPGGVQLITIDVRSGLRHVAKEIPDSSAREFSPLSGGGWAWWSLSGWRGHLMAGDAGESVILPVLNGEIGSGIGTREAPSHQAVSSWGVSANTDTAFLDVTTLPRGPTTRWAAFSNPWGNFSERWLTDGSLIVWLQQTEDQEVLYRVRGPGQVQPLGVIPRSLESLDISQDGRHAAMVTRDFRGDIWLAHLKRVGGR